MRTVHTYLHSVVVVLTEQLQEPQQWSHALQLWCAHHAGPGHHVDRVPLLGRDGGPAAGSGALLSGHRGNNIELFLNMKFTNKTYHCHHCEENNMC